MRILSKRTLREFWERHSDAEDALLAWYREVKREDWSTPAQVLGRYPTASIVGADRAVFRIKGSRYRLVVGINYQKRTVYVRFLGTHAEYDRIDAGEV